MAKRRARGHGVSLSRHHRGGYMVTLRWVDEYGREHRRRLKSDLDKSRALEWGKQQLALELDAARDTMHSLDEAARAWVEMGMGTGINGEDPWSAVHASEQQRLAPIVCDTKIGGVRLGDLPFQEAAKMARELQTQLARKGYANRTINGHVDVVRGAVTAALELGWCDDAPRVVKRLRPGKRRLWLTPGDAFRLSESCRDARFPERDRLVVLLGLRAGLRCGEIRALKWRDIESRTIGGERVTCLRVCRNMPSNGRGPAALKAPKNGRHRLVPLHGEVAAALVTWIRKCGVSPSADGGRFVFTQVTNPDAPIDHQSINRAAKLAAERIGLTCMGRHAETKEAMRTDEAVTSHVLRKSFAAHLQAQGYKVEASQMLGHTTADAPSVTDEYAVDIEGEEIASLNRRLAAIRSLPWLGDAANEATPADAPRAATIEDLESQIRPGGCATHKPPRSSVPRKTPRSGVLRGVEVAPATGLECVVAGEQAVAESSFSASHGPKEAGRQVWLDPHEGEYAEARPLARTWSGELSN